jgi:hypothetical protein
VRRRNSHGPNSEEDGSPAIGQRVHGVPDGGHGRRCSLLSIKPENERLHRLGRRASSAAGSPTASVASTNRDRCRFFRSRSVTPFHAPVTASTSSSPSPPDVGPLSSMASHDDPAVPPQKILLKLLRCFRVVSNRSSHGGGESEVPMERPRRAPNGSCLRTSFDASCIRLRH